MMTVDGLRSSLIHASLSALELFPLDCSRRKGGSGNVTKSRMGASIIMRSERSFFSLHIKVTCWIK